MAPNEPNPSTVAEAPAREEDSARPPRESVYKRGLHPSARAVEDFAEVASDFADLAADWAGAFAKGMRTFSQILGDRPRKDDRQTTAEVFVRAGSESASVVLDELAAVTRKSSKKLTREE